MKKNKFKQRKEENSNSPFENRKKFCPFSQKGSPDIDYKDIIFIPNRGKEYEHIKIFFNGINTLYWHFKCTDFR